MTSTPPGLSCISSNTVQQAHLNAPFYGAFLFSVFRQGVLQADGNWGQLGGAKVVAVEMPIRLLKLKLCDDLELVAVSAGQVNGGIF